MNADGTEDPGELSRHGLDPELAAALEAEDDAWFAEADAPPEPRPRTDRQRAQRSAVRHAARPPLPLLLRRASEVVEAVEDGEGAADDLLRRRFRKPQKGWTMEDVGTVANAVMTWFRWRGGFDERVGPGGLGAALRLQKRFDTTPESFAEDELRQKAIPAWASPLFSLEDLRALQRPPRLWLRCRPGGAAALAEVLPGVSRHPSVDDLPDAVLFQGRENLFRHPGFTGGRFELQDVSSQRVAAACAAKAGQTWWDVCAGEGGKTMALADAMENKGLIRATDRHSWRVDRLKRRAARLERFNLRVDVWDGTRSGPPFKTMCDGVLVDAPCSGVGTWRRDPHARWGLDPAALPQLAALQGHLLGLGATRVKPGGRLVYAVCTLTPEETDAVADAFERAHPDFAPIPMGAGTGRAQGKTRHVWHPGDEDGNGMFVATWVRGG